MRTITAAAIGGVQRGHHRNRPRQPGPAQPAHAGGGTAKMGMDDIMTAAAQFGGQCGKIARPPGPHDLHFGTEKPADVPARQRIDRIAVQQERNVMTLCLNGGEFRKMTLRPREFPGREAVQNSQSGSHALFP